MDQSYDNPVNEDAKEARASRADAGERSRGYQVLARRFRPVGFNDLVGQPAVLASLRACLGKQRLPHAFLFCGSRGVGKTSTARILARAVNCEKLTSEDHDPAEPCGLCESCKSILAGHATDVVELDAASNNGVDEVRALREQASYSPLRLRKKVFILDEAHMFSKSAFNALLKILEEPPAHVLFILATTELHKLPDTVRSRCQVLSFRRINEADIADRLAQICSKEGVEVAPAVLHEIAVASMGGLRDAETALERILPMADGLDLETYRRIEGRLGLNRAAELVRACLEGRQDKALHYAAQATEIGVDERECLGEVLQVLRLVFLILVDGPDTLLVDAERGFRDTLLGLAEQTDKTRIDAMMQILILARERIRLIEDRQAMLELTLVRLARIGELVSLGELSLGSEQTSHEAAPPPSAPTARADPWERSLELIVQGGRSMLGQILGRAKVSWVGKDRLLLELPELPSLHRELLESQTHVDFVHEKLAEACGHQVSVEIRTVAADAEASTTGSSGTASESPASEEAATAKGARPVQDAEKPVLPKLAQEIQKSFRTRLFD